MRSSTPRKAAALAGFEEDRTLSGVAAPASAGDWACRRDAAPDPDRADLRVTGQDRIFAMGDIALTVGHQLLQLAQPALP